VAVIRVPDEDWGQRVHAVVQPRDPFLPPSVAVLDQHCREHLPAYKVLKSYEFVEQLPRSAVGKIRRSQMVEARDSGWTSEMIRVGE
jgi:acyl-CoA synthetase (AMP-forming)/AMP-acid ligase II